MIDWWNLQPTWLKRLRLFLGIVWRMHEGNRMTCALSWDVAKCLYPIKNRGHGFNSERSKQRENGGRP
jgi:hypothetical protein